MMLLLLMNHQNHQLHRQTHRKPNQKMTRFHFSPQLAACECPHQRPLRAESHQGLTSPTYIPGKHDNHGNMNKKKKETTGKKKDGCEIAGTTLSTLGTPIPVHPLRPLGRTPYRHPSVPANAFSRSRPKNKHLRTSHAARTLREGSRPALARRSTPACWTARAAAPRRGGSPNRKPPAQRKTNKRTRGKLS